MSYEGSATGIPTLFLSTLEGGVDGGTLGSGNVDGGCPGTTGWTDGGVCGNFLVGDEDGTGDVEGIPPGMIGWTTGDFCLDFLGGNGTGAIGSVMGASLFDAFVF